MHPTDPLTEHRRQHDLRAIFPAACESLRPFFAPENQWAGQSHEHLALRTLKEQFPQLGPQTSFLVVSTVKRLVANHSYSPPAHKAPDV